jgi:ribonuclease-3
VKTIVGSAPLNLELYKLATRHISAAKKNDFGLRESNERLEYLGDALLGAVVADYLFKKFPYKDEGFLTDIRSRIVNREALNGVAKKIGIRNIIDYDQAQSAANGRGKALLSHKSMEGDTLEALVGAVYLDKGYAFCRNFILKRIIIPHFDLEAIVNTNPNFKSTIIEWAQKNNRDIRFEIVDTRGDKHHREFIAEIYLDDKPICKGGGYSKKKAEQSASRKAMEIIAPSDEAQA